MKNATLLICCALLLTPVLLRAQQAEVVPAISTGRTIPGKPYELAAKRIVFANWYYIDPGDLDWFNKEGKSIYVHGNEAPGEATFKGIRTPRGIRLRAHKPDVRGPIEIPHRCILQDVQRYHGWTDSEYFESADGFRWNKVANLNLEMPAFAGGVHQVFIDPSAPPEQRYKTVWTTDNLTKEQFDSIRKKRPDGWEPRALLDAATRPGGSVTIEVVGVNGHALADCDPVTGNAFWTPVTWRGVDDTGQAIPLRIRMDRASLFDPQFE